MDVAHHIGTTAKELLEKIDIAAEVEITMQERTSPEERDTYFININGENLGLLIGYKGENLDSLETVLAMMINSKSEEKVRIVLDIGEWRKDRYVQIERIVENAMNRMEEEGLEEIHLSPMKPHERRKAHEIITGRGYTSESNGYEPNRRITIKR